MVHLLITFPTYLYTRNCFFPSLVKKGNSEDMKCRVCVITESIIKPSPSPSAELALTQRAEPWGKMTCTFCHNYLVCSISLFYTISRNSNKILCWYSCLNLLVGAAVTLSTANPSSLVEDLLSLWKAAGSVHSWVLLSMLCPHGCGLWWPIHSTQWSMFL